MAAAPSTSRKFFIGGNWKCNGTLESSKALATGLAGLDVSGVDVVVAPIAIQIPAVQAALAESAIEVSSQNVSATGTGAFTGEIAPSQLIDIGLKYTIVGHSERRTYFGDTDEVVTKKVSNALSGGLNVIACLGETQEERDAGRVEEVVGRQLDAIIAGVDGAWSQMVIAYEPVWAIGTGKTCGKDDAQAVHEKIRAKLSEISAEVGQNTRILYGGSVKPKNAAELIAMPDIDGFLVGGASLKTETFGPIIEAAQKQAKSDASA